jgi:hypothetical protein
VDLTNALFFLGVAPDGEFFFHLWLSSKRLINGMTVGTMQVAYNALKEYEVTFIRVQEFGKFFEDDIDSNNIRQRLRSSFVTTFLDSLNEKPSPKVSEVVSRFCELYHHLLMANWAASFCSADC